MSVATTTSRTELGKAGARSVAEGRVSSVLRTSPGALTGGATASWLGVPSQGVDDHAVVGLVA